MAGILIITTLMHNVKAEAITGDNDKAKIKAVSGDKDENQQIKEIMLKSGDYYPAFFDTVLTYQTSSIRYKLLTCDIILLIIFHKYVSLCDIL